MAACRHCTLQTAPDTPSAGATPHRACAASAAQLVFRINILEHSCLTGDLIFTAVLTYPTAVLPCVPFNIMLPSEPR